VEYRKKRYLREYTRKLLPSLPAKPCSLKLLAATKSYSLKSLAATKSCLLKSLAAAVVEEVRARNVVDASELGSSMSTLLSNEQQMVGLRLGQNEHIEVPPSALKLNLTVQTSSNLMKKS
jgi:hypothetical protein